MIACALAAPLALPEPGAAATREPLSLYRAALREPGAATSPVADPDPSALSAARRDRTARLSTPGAEARLSSTYYGEGEMAAVAAVLRGLDHGPELSLLSAYVATAEEISAICGATVLACYFPARMEMVVSGVDRPVAGVPREFAIAHEYGHHIANTQRDPLLAAGGAGTIRWATYERVCQFTRARRLHPGEPGARYWEDPEEAFAESYAHLSRPTSSVSWQFTPLLRPTAASLAKIHADVTRPWSGPVTSTLTGSLVEPPETSAAAAASAAGPGIGEAAVVGRPPWVASRRIETPLDGTVTVSVDAPEGASLAVTLRDREGGRVLSHGVATGGESGEVSYGNCGHQSLWLELRALDGGGPFRATVVRP